MRRSVKFDDGSASQDGMEVDSHIDTELDTNDTATSITK